MYKFLNKSSKTIFQDNGYSGTVEVDIPLLNKWNHSEKKQEYQIFQLFIVRIKKKNHQFYGHYVLQFCDTLLKCGIHYAFQSASCIIRLQTTSIICKTGNLDNSLPRYFIVYEIAWKTISSYRVLYPQLWVTRQRIIQIVCKIYQFFFHSSPKL